jgi:hypothetical protein
MSETQYWFRSGGDGGPPGVDWFLLGSGIEVEGTILSVFEHAFTVTDLILEYRDTASFEHWHKHA